MGSSIIIVVFGIGLLLVLAEIFIIPGTKITGVLGMLMLFIGVVLTYMTFGAQAGNWVLLATIVFSIVSIAALFYILGNRNIGVQGTIDGRVNVIDEESIHEGDEGIAMGDIKPTGKAVIKNEIFYVASQGEFIDDDSPIRVVKVTSNVIYVEEKAVA